MLAGIQLSTDEIGQLLCPGNPYRFRNTQCRGGRGLMGCMHITDLVMTLTGEDASHLHLTLASGFWYNGREDLRILRRENLDRLHHVSILLVPAVLLWLKACAGCACRRQPVHLGPRGAPPDEGCSRRKRVQVHRQACAAGDPVSGPVLPLGLWGDGRQEDDAQHAHPPAAAHTQHGREQHPEQGGPLVPQLPKMQSEHTHTLLPDV